MLELNGTLIAVILNFIIMMAILNFFLYKPVLKMLDDRKKLIEDNFADAKAKVESARELKENYDHKIAVAENESKKIIDEAQKFSETLKKDSIQAARLEAMEIRKTAHADAQKIRDDVGLKMKSMVALLSVDIAGKILRRSIKADEQADLIDDFVDKIDNARLN